MFERSEEESSLSFLESFESPLNLAVMTAGLGIVANWPVSGMRW